MNSNLINNQIKIYNSFSSKKEIFIPIIKGIVGIYTCGPTVYNSIHLGNCRTFISFDLIIRYFKHLGYKVRYIRNITDVGHLEDNKLEKNEDKILKRARIECLEPMEIVQKYTIDFHSILSLFNVLPPNIEPTATGHILEQIEVIKKLINKNLAYEVKGSVYFNLYTYSKFIKKNPNLKNYGILSNRKIENLILNTRPLKGQHEKKNLQDFAIWKKASKNHIMRWPSPWGEGFPGWHIECTVMSTKYLGNVFDIHGGGIDLKFPHHECELAQSQGIYEKNPVKYWIHVNMLTINNKKMSKSINNMILPFDIFTGKNSLLEKSFSPEVIRFFILKSHYRSILNFSNHALISAEKSYNRLMRSFINLEKILPIKKKKVSNFDIILWRKNCYEAMNDDFNSPKLIACLFEVCPLIDSIYKSKEYLNSFDLNILKNTMKIFYLDVLGLKNPFLILKKSFSSIKNLLKQNQFLLKNLFEDFLKEDSLINDFLNKKSFFDLNKTKDLINIILRIRENARKNKNWNLSDKIRNELLKIGYTFYDKKDGTTSINI